MRGLPLTKLTKLTKQSGRLVPLAAAGLAAAGLAAAGTALISQPACAAAGAHSRREGDILRLFARQTVYIVTNDDAALAEALLADCGERERHVVSVEEWRGEPAALRQMISPIFLINRERLAEGPSIPAGCDANADEIWTEVRHTGRAGGPNYEVTISAPDSAWLRRAVLSFRNLTGVPRKPIRQSVRSVVVVPVGSGAEEAARLFVRRQNAADDFNKRTAAHLLPTALALPGGHTPPRCAGMKELVLVDRSSAAENSPSLPERKALASPGDTVAWRESGSDGRTRVVCSAPSAGALFEALRRTDDPFSLPETLTVLASARDLRTVRRVAVASVRNGAGGPEMAKHIASVAATRLRALQAFEVLERAGLSEILGEVALNQAGITHATDRTRVRQLAAADTLLIVEVTGVEGKTDYASKAERLTPPIGPAPRRPAEPTRLRYDILFPGSEDNALVRSVTESVLSKAVGTKSRREYRSAIDDYNETVLPRWQDELDRYYTQREKRQIDWKQNIVARSTATVRGSLRFVDLADGLVLWEAPFSATEKGENSWGTRRAITYGEDSGEPGLPDDCPASRDSTADALVDQAVDTALAEGMQALQSTALLPASEAVTSADTAAPSSSVPAPPIKGRLLDVDGDSLLIGLGAGDGVKLGDTLLIHLANGKIARVVTTRVRPRTCDAAFAPDVVPLLRTRAAIGQTVTPLSQGAEK